MKRSLCWKILNDSPGTKTKFCEEYSVIIMGCSVEDLQRWATPVIEMSAHEYRMYAKQERKKSMTAYIGSFF